MLSLRPMPFLDFFWMIESKKHYWYFLAVVETILAVRWPIFLQNFVSYYLVKSKKKSSFLLLLHLQFQPENYDLTSFLYTDNVSQQASLRSRWIRSMPAMLAARVRFLPVHFSSILLCTILIVIFRPKAQYDRIETGFHNLHPLLRMSLVAQAHDLDFGV